MASNQKTIGILTGGGDVPGLNPAIRAITIRALREGYRVVGIRRGWAGLVDYDPEKGADNSDNVQELSEADVNRAGRSGGTFLHTSRTRPSHLPPRKPSRACAQFASRYRPSARNVRARGRRNGGIGLGRCNDDMGGAGSCRVSRDGSTDGAETTGS